MKLRIRGNSVRVRLTKTEVARLGDGFRVEQRTQFGPLSALISSVSPSANINHPAIQFKDGALSVLLPAEQIWTWAHSDQITIEATQDVGPGIQLAIVVEKDFECVHSRAEKDGDAFPNPRLKQSDRNDPVPERSSK